MTAASEALKKTRSENAKAKSANSTGWSDQRLADQAARMREIGKKNRKEKPREGEYQPPAGSTGSRKSPSPPAGSAPPRSGGSRRGLDDPNPDKGGEKTADDQAGQPAAPKKRFIDEKMVLKFWPLIVRKIYIGMDRVGRAAGWFTTFFLRRAGILHDDEKLVVGLKILDKEDEVVVSELTAPAAAEKIPEWIGNNPIKAFFLALAFIFFVQGTVEIKQEAKKNARTKPAGLPSGEPEDD